MRTAAIGLALALAAPTYGSLMTNASWQTGDNTGWIQTKGGFVTGDAPGCAANAPGESDGYVWGQTGAYSVAHGSVEQAAVPAIPGLPEYDVDAGVWLTLFDTGGKHSSITADLLIDDTVVDSDGLSGSAVDTDWTWVDLSYDGPIDSEAVLRVSFEMDALSGTELATGDPPTPWAWVWADGADITIVPEPITLVSMLVLGVIPLLIRRR